MKLEVSTLLEILAHEAERKRPDVVCHAVSTLLEILVDQLRFVGRNEFVDVSTLLEILEGACVLGGI